MFLKACRLFSALILLHPVLTAQTPVNQQLRMRSLSVNEGLPQGAVTGIAQDSRGFIWISSDGLSRYDGRNFIHFHHIAGDTSSLTSNFIVYIRLDDRQNLWVIYSDREVDVFNTFTGRVRHISAEKNYKWLHSTRDNNWFITQENGHYFEANVISLTEFDPWGTYRQKIPLPSGESLLAIGATHHGINVIATDKALYKIQGSQLSRIIVFPPASKEAKEWVRATVMSSFRFPGRVLETPDGVLVSPGPGCIYLYDQKIRRMNRIPVGGMFWGITQADGYFYARAAEGLIRFNKQGIITQLTRVVNVRLTELLLMDRSGVLWAATGNATGLRLLDMRPVNFLSWNYTNGFLHDALEPWLHNPMQDEVAYGSYEGRCTKDRNGNIWVVSNIGVVSNESARKLHWQGRYWPGSGVYRLGANQAWKLPFHLPGWKVTNIAFDSRNQCWLTICSLTGKTGNRLVKVDTQTGDITSFAELPDVSLGNYQLSSIGNKVCVVMENELRLYDTVTAACTIFSKEQVGSDGMLLMELPDLHDNRILWLATKGSGIIKLNIETRQLVHYTEANGLPNNTVYYMARDKQGFFWCSSNKGIFRFDPATGATMSFLAKDGLQGNEFNRYHFMESPDGHFIFGGTEGYTIFHPDSVAADHFQTPVIISDVQVNNQPLQKAVPALKDRLVSTLEQLTLAHNQSFLSISFAGLQYNAPEEIHYRYRLRGLDDGWIDGGTDASAKYAYIPPGHYTFMVNASNTSGLWSNQVKKLEITILPPWWKTPWAYMLYILVATGITYTIYRNWQNRVRDKQRLFLQQKEAEQLKAMDEMKSRFFSNITHEFRTPLTLIIAPIEQMQRHNTEPMLRQQLGTVQRNAEQLLQLINQLLDMAKLEAGSMHITLHRGNLPVFLQEITDRFAFQAAQQKISLTCQLPVVITREHAFDADKLRKIVQNLLGNAIKFTPANGAVSIKAALEPVSETTYLLRISIEDTGIGIAADKLPHIFTRFYQADDSGTRSHGGTGIGLALVKELTELMGGTITAANNPGGATGMLFSLTLPVKRASGMEEPLLVNEVRESPAIHELPIISVPVQEGKGDPKPLLLVAEDHEELNAFICSIFHPTCRILAARNGKEGWQLAQQHLPDIIISDVMMPEGDGMEFCRKVKSDPDTSHIAFLLLTARASPGSRVEGLESRADDFISKPFHPEELQLRVRNMLQQRQQLQQFYNRQLTVGEEPLQRAQKTDPFLEQVYVQVEEHLDDTGFTVDQLAVDMAVSTRTLSRKLHAIAGITPADLIKQYRLKKAAGLLREGMPVSEVAWSVGFETGNYFSTAFKAFYGVKPSEYAKAGVGKQP